MSNVSEGARLTKQCGACGRSFPSDAVYCPSDGALLSRLGERERPAVDPYLGQEISGHIEIRERIGNGAMGRVYRAFQKGIDRDVAVKILHRELSANPQIVTRFTREAKVASRLQHPNVVQVLLAGQLQDRALYMVMEYLDGVSLQRALDDAGGALPLGRALHVALQLCDAVGEAHAQGIIHRDLKPENVMLVRRGSDPDFVKVLDFGIARIDWIEQSVATAAGLIFGTARYISPEGAQGAAVRPASDVYSLGTLTYQMLAGRTPFEGEQAVALLVQQIHDQAPPLRSLPQCAHVPAPIADVVMRCLAKDPALRLPDARALREALFAAMRSTGVAGDDFTRTPLTPLASVTSESELRASHAELSATAKWGSPHEVAAQIEARTQGVGGEAAMFLAGTVVEEPAVANLRSRVDATLDGSLDVRVASAPLPTVVPLHAVASPPVLAEMDRESRVVSSRSQSPGRGKAIALVVACFALGVALALGWAWKSGKLGGSEAAKERLIERATAAMIRHQFAAPPGDNVQEITAEGLRRWPSEPRLLDIRVRAANELTSQAIAQRAAGDVHEALKLAKLAQELEPNDASANQLVEQYEAEIASPKLDVAPPLSGKGSPTPKPAIAEKAAPPPAPPVPVLGPKPRPSLPTLPGLVLPPEPPPKRAPPPPASSTGSVKWM
jgi:serine/threonine protein kinase